MEIREYPFYGLGIIAYAVAYADGSIQHRERRELMEVINEWSDRVEVEFDVAEIIFSILANSKHTQELSYEKGFNYIRTGKEFLNESLKEKFVFLLKDVAHAFPPVTDTEKAVIEKFEEDLKAL